MLFTAGRNPQLSSYLCAPAAASAWQPANYQRWAAAPRDASYVEDEAVCMEYLPQQPKTWNPFSCVSTSVPQGALACL